MVNIGPRITLFAAVSVLLLLLPLSAHAQCGVNVFMPSLVAQPVTSTATSNPFQAIRTTTYDPPMDSRLLQLPLLQPQTVARDSEGRVLVDRVTGKFRMDSGPDAGAEIESHAITICDPVKASLTQIVTSTRSATIRSFATRGGKVRVAPRPFCQVPQVPANDSSDLVVESLGHREIEGLDAIGWRVTKNLPAPGTSPQATIQRTTETWCSEDLAAVLLTVVESSGNSRKETVQLTQIRRIEPDPSLFQIPPDYTVSESVASPLQHPPGLSQVQPQSEHPPLVTH